MSKTLVTFTLTGMPQIQRRLAALQPKVQQAIVRKALRRACLPIQKYAKSHAPKRTGALRAGIKLRSIFSLPGKHYKRIKGLVGLSVFTAFPNTFYARWMEFGAPKHRTFGGGLSPLSQHKFMRGAFDHVAQRSYNLYVALVHSYVLTAARGGTP